MLSLLNKRIATKKTPNVQFPSFLPKVPTLSLQKWRSVGSLPVPAVKHFSTAAPLYSLKNFLNFSTEKEEKEKDKGKEKEKEKDKDKDKEREKDKGDTAAEKSKGKDDKEGKETDGEKRGSDSEKEDEEYSKSKRILILAAIVLFCLYLYDPEKPPSGATRIDFSEFEHMLEDDRVGRIEVVNNRQVRVTPKGEQRLHYFHIIDIDSFDFRIDEIQAHQGKPLLDFVDVKYTQLRTPLLLEVVLSVGPILLLFYGFGMVARNGMTGNIFNMGQSNFAKVNVDKKVNVKFSDVAGLTEAKQEIMEFVHFLKKPEKYKALGARIPKGALLVGPPGTGKTLLAKATAGEAAVPFFSISGSDFVEMFVGVGPSRVRELFTKARENTPSIIFIDEIDAVGKSRSRGNFYNDERENTLNQILVEMDGFNTQVGVVVFAGTNRPDVLDKALTRPGRFDRVIALDLPDVKGRQEIFKVHLKPLKLKDSADFLSEKLATLTPGFSGADVANVCNEAALIAARHNKTQVELVDFEAAIERVIGGLEKKNKVLSQEEKNIVAHHEAGHAIVGWFLEHAYPLLKVSIIPRGVAALGYAMYQPRDQYLWTTEQINDNMCMALGGRAAESIMFGRVSTGAKDDLEKVTSMAYSQVVSYGMNKVLGNISYPPPKEYQFEPMYSQATSKVIDIEVRKIVDDAYERTLSVLREKKDQLIQVAQQLKEKEVLTREDMIQLVGPRPFPEEVTFHQLIYEKPQSQSPPPSSSPPPPSSSPPPPSNSFSSFDKI